MKHFFLTSLLVIFNVTVTFAFDSIISVLDLKNQQSIEYYSKIFKDQDLHAYSVNYDGEPCYSQVYSIQPTGTKIALMQATPAIPVKEKKDTVITIIFFITFSIILFFIGINIYKFHKKSQDEYKAHLKAEDEKRAKQQKEIDIEHEKYIKQLTDEYGAITRIITLISSDYDFIKHYDDIIVFEKPKKVIIGKSVYNFTDILSCSMYDENHKDIPLTQVTRIKTKTGSMLGRAAVGGLTFGVAGAVVGALTAKKETKSDAVKSYHEPSYIVKIGIKSIENPTIILKMHQNKEQADNIYALMQAIIAM